VTDEVPRYRFTVTLNQDEAEQVARGVVPVAVQNVVIGLLVDVRASPGDSLDAMKRRRRQREKP